MGPLPTRLGHQAWNLKNLTFDLLEKVGRFFTDLKNSKKKINRLKCQGLENLVWGSPYTYDNSIAPPRHQTLFWPPEHSPKFTKFCTHISQSEKLYVYKKCTNPLNRDPLIDKNTKFTPALSINVVETWDQDQHVPWVWILFRWMLTFDPRQTRTELFSVNMC